MSKTFTMVVEDRHDPAGKGFEREVPWDGDHVPDLIQLPSDETLYVVVGRMLSPGNRYGYRPATRLALD